MYTPFFIDKERNFRYGMKALSFIEKKFRKNLSAIDFENLTIEETMIIIQAGLVHEDKGLTVDRLLDLIDEHNVKLAALVEAMSTAMNDAFGTPEDGEQTNPQEAAEE